MEVRVFGGERICGVVLASVMSPSRVFCGLGDGIMAALGCEEGIECGVGVCSDGKGLDGRYLKPEMWKGTTGADSTATAFSVVEGLDGRYPMLENGGGLILAMGAVVTGCGGCEDGGVGKGAVTTVGAAAP